MREHRMDKKVKLITESNLDNFEIITESGDESRPATIKMRGVYLASDVKNGNSRIYPYEEFTDVPRTTITRYTMRNGLDKSTK